MKNTVDADIELNQQFKYALRIMENTRQSVFITGRAGTGKSTLLEYFRTITRKKVVVLAPTGVAALNVKGQTVHSFFRFKPDITPEKVKEEYKNVKNTLYKELDAIVIDEISMVRADLLDCVDIFLRQNGPKKRTPFGGLQMILVGDLYQLPPVVTGEEKKIFSSVYATPYFFSAHVMQKLDLEYIELEKIYRQHDERFILLLNHIRNNSITEEELEELNSRYLPDYEPYPDEFFIYLTTTNALADRVNSFELSRLEGKQYVFSGSIEGQFGREYLPTATVLELKPGAQVMLLNNDAARRWVNGTLGRVTAIQEEKNSPAGVMVTLADGAEVLVYPYTWEIFRFYIEHERLRSEIVGTFTQYPLMLAWAVTIHKAQGKTFERVLLDLGRGTFAHGQVYVALSRCTRLEGLYLRQPLLKKHIWMDRQVVDFVTHYQYGKAEQALSLQDRLEMIRHAIQQGKRLKLVYLKPDDTKSTRTIEPLEVGQMEYAGKSFTGLRAYCLERQDERTFRVDRILEMQEE